MKKTSSFMPSARAALWSACREFHGHACPGLALGLRVAEEALALLDNASPAPDEEVVCVAETDACAIDAIQRLTGCTLGKGSLVLRPRGKYAFSFFARNGTHAWRILWNDKAETLPREERIQHFLTALGPDLFRVEAPPYTLPEKARIYAALPCATCGETTAEPFLRLHAGTLVCLDCYNAPLRAPF